MKGVVERTPKTHAYLNLGSPLNAISASHDGTVKIVSLENDEQPKVVINLRAGKTQSLNYTGNDCCWHPSQVENYKYLISTAATNGAVVVWNITREGARSVEKVWTDHNRAVNKLAWHPEKSDFLLTGSQDTTLKLSVVPPPPSPPRTEKGVLYIHSPLGAGKTDKIVDPSILFEYFAKNYKFKDLPFNELCQHNESVALRVNQYQIAKLWSILRLYYDNEDNNDNNSNNNNNINNSLDNNNDINNKQNENNNNNINSKQKQQQDLNSKEINSKENSNNSNSNVNSSNNNSIIGGSQQLGVVSGNGILVTDDKLLMGGGSNSLDGNSMEGSAIISSGKNNMNSPVFIDDQSSSASLGNSNGLLDDSDDDPIYSILSAEAVTPLVSLPTRAPSPTSKLDGLDSSSISSSSSLRKKFNSFNSLNMGGVGDGSNHHHHHHHHSNNESIILRSVSSSNLDIMNKSNVSTMFDQPPSSLSKRRYKQHAGSGSNSITIVDSDLSMSMFPELEIPQFDMHPVIVEILESCIERGDVQTCVFTVLIMKDRLKLDSLRVSQWFGSYVELLHRFKMWNCANEIMKSCEDPSVGSLSQRSTSILISCGCGKTLTPNNWVCDKCGTVPAECSVCRLPVKGAFAWCQGCGHGGHLEHMKKWFESDHEVCPTGSCTHICKPRTTIIA
ncbi:WD40 repeat-containing protein [Heterostelium album PN500]|uniref:WD40 repeat-containing protein n=1 Tax=Heterostelium pallidum (strain ATCC 26659 / Pp 5 / PN500) TaxID=670386 RepID=D3BC64_HETP5|nr:WD40 repeat-containing protein [Heterostelium album PN500]EFA81247.1 WD40 repeat-containing protein [Heterostelium album PN500]|eukprot:XP_020433365.1 WD40 repeat-containing protein [Heterostelium album PN500]